jgi:PAS domain S-box-containing protein
MEPLSLSITSYTESERFQLFMESVTDYALYILTPEDFVCSWNAGAERFKGYTADEIMGQHFKVRESKN